jgi:radical SAM-linked protein
MRIRLRFTKLGKIRFTSQRDVARMWERALRRAELPLAYTEGFSPRPQLSFGLALPTTCESLAEYLDVVLDDERPETTAVSVEDLPDRMSGLLPEGLSVTDAGEVERRSGSLQQQVTSCSWTMRFRGVSRQELEESVAALLQAETVPIERERKGRQEVDDLRPSVLALAVSTNPDPMAGHWDRTDLLSGIVDRGGAQSVGVVAELATQPRGVRPIELIRGLIAVSTPGSVTASEVGTSEETTATPGPVLDRACRTQQWIERDGHREEPLDTRDGPAHASRAPHALERAS